MARGSYKPNQDLCRALVRQGKNTYTVTSIRDLLIESVDGEVNKSDMRRWVNGQFQTLLKHGYIESLPAKGKRTQFRNTDKLFRTIDTNDCEVQTNELTISLEQLSILKKRLRNYQMDIVISTGETKECEEIASLIPAMRTKVQKRYNISKEKNIELIGRIKVLETLIDELDQCT